MVCVLRNYVTDRALTGAVKVRPHRLMLGGSVLVLQVQERVTGYTSEAPLPPGRKPTAPEERLVWRDAGLEDLVLPGLQRLNGGN